MGCGCKERGRLIVSAVKHLVHGDATGAAGRAEAVVASAAHSAAKRLSTLRAAARARPHGKAG